MAGMRQDRAVDGFRLAYDRTGQGAHGPAVVLLHGWPGDRTDYRAVAPLVAAAADVIVPDLRGFGESDKHEADPAEQYNAAAQARSQLDLCPALIDGKPDAVRSYLRHFWSHWSGPGYEPADGDLDHLVSVYGAPGAFGASIAWYRAGAGAVAASLTEQVPAPDQRIGMPTTVLWPSHDPLFPPPGPTGSGSSSPRPR